MRKRKLPRIQEHPGTAELPEGFAEVIGWLHSEDGMEWTQRNFRQPHDLRAFRRAFFELKKILDGDGAPDTWDGSHYAGLDEHYCADRFYGYTGGLWRASLNGAWTEPHPWLPDLPPEGGIPLRSKT